MNPLIELSLPEEKTMKGVSSRLQKHGGRSCVSWLRLGGDPINTDVDLGVLEAQGRRTVQRQLSLGFFHLFPSDDRGGHVSTRFPLKSSDSLHRTHWYPTESLKTSSMMIQHRGLRVFISWLCRPGGRIIKKREGVVYLGMGINWKPYSYVIERNG